MKGVALLSTIGTERQDRSPRGRRTAGGGKPKLWGSIR
jgi:hypothetical protein